MTDHIPGVAADRRRDCITWAIAEAPYPNERESGDRCVCRATRDGLLIAAVDGMGHGVEAAAAAKIAINTIVAHAIESPIALMLRCHEELKGTRGAVITAAHVHLAQQTLTWVGVGNVEAMLFHGGPPRIARPERLLLRNGILGYRVPPIRGEVLALTPLDTLILVTDGIDARFADGLDLDDDPQAVADRILVDHYTGFDDALVVVARYLGGECEGPTA